MATGGVHGTAEVVSVRLGVHAHLVVRVANRRAEAVLLVARADGGQEVDDEAPDIEDVDEGDDPLEDGGGVDAVVAALLEDAEGDGDGDFDDDEGQLDPEGDAQDAVLAEVDAEALVFGADEEGGDDVAATEKGVLGFYGL